MAWRGRFADGKVNNGTNESTGRFLDFSSAPVLRARAPKLHANEIINQNGSPYGTYLIYYYVHNILGEFDLRTTLCTRIRRERGRFFCFDSDRGSVAAARNQYAVNERKLFCFSAIEIAGESILTAASENIRRRRQ